MACRDCGDGSDGIFGDEAIAGVSVGAIVFIVAIIGFAVYRWRFRQ